MVWMFVAFLILHVRSKYPVGEIFRQVDLSQFFLGNSGPLKRQNELRTYIEVLNRTAVNLLNWR
jgi:hypothetical protein